MFGKATLQKKYVLYLQKGFTLVNYFNTSLYKSTLYIFLLFVVGSLYAAETSPVKFQENKGQWDAHIHYMAQIPAGRMYVEKGAFTYAFMHEGDIRRMHEMHHGQHSSATEKDMQVRMHAYKIRMLGSNEDAVYTGAKQASDYVNYYLGNDSTRWASGVRQYAEVTGTAVYPKTDVKIYYNKGYMKYDFVLQPGGDPAMIQLAYEGPQKMYLKRGSLIIETSVNTIIEKKPVAFQKDGDDWKQVPCEYVLKKNVLSFRFPSGYNPKLPLIIDPMLVFSTYTGSTADNWGFTATYDSQGNLYAGGISFSPGYPLTMGAYQITFGGGTVDVSITKFNDIGTSLLYSTYLGGSSAECPHSLVVDNNDQLIVFGTTGSTNFPTTLGAYDVTFNGGNQVTIYTINYSNGSDIFVTKFNASGTALIGSTFVGGTSNDGLNTASGLQFGYGDQFRGEVIVDNADNIYFASTTASANFPTTPGVFQSVYGGGPQDAVVCKLNPMLTGMVFSTFLGGTAADAAYGIQLNSLNIPYIAGGTASTNFPVTPGTLHTTNQGGIDGFLSRLNASGTALTASTYMGTPQYDQNFFVQLDLYDDVYVVGQTQGNYPITPGAYNNPNSGQYIHKLNPNLTTTIFSTTFGSSQGKVDISLNAFLVNNCDHIYVAGWGGFINVNYGGQPLSSTNGMVSTPGAHKPTTDGSDFYLMVLDSNAVQLLYATFFGGNGGPSWEHVDGGTSRFDKKGVVYHAVCGGCGGTSNFPTTPGVWSNNNLNNNCNLAAFKFDMSQLKAGIANNLPPVICTPPGTVTFTNNSNGGNVFFWDFGDGNTSTQTNPTHTYNDTGTYTIMLIAMDSLACVLEDTAYTSIIVKGLPEADISASVSICPGDSTQLIASGGDTYKWIPASGLSNDTIPNPWAKPDSTTEYMLVVSNLCGSDTAYVTVSVYTDNTTAIADTFLCIGQDITLWATGGVSYVWSPVTYLSNPNIANPLCTPLQTIQYTVTITDADGCEWEKEVTIQVDTVLPKALALSDTTICRGDTIQLFASGGHVYKWYPNYQIDTLFNDTVSVNPLVSTTYYVIATNGCGSDTTSVQVDVQWVDATVCKDTAVCIGNKAYLYASGGTMYEWKPAAGMSNPTGAETDVSIYTPTHFAVKVSDSLGCFDIKHVYVDTLNSVVVSAGPGAVIDYFEYYILKGSGNGTPVWQPPTALSCVNCFNPKASPEVTTEYILTVTDSNGCKNSDTVLVIVKGNLYVPNSFTPDGDGINDIFYAFGVNLKDYKMQIFNRWGELIFESDALKKGWDGTYKGKPCPVETYVWKVYYTDDANISKEATGHVSLIK